MAFYVSPLVDIKEVDLTTSIGAASSSLACIVVRNPYMGREGTKYFTTTTDEFISVWGQPTNDEGNYCDILSAQGYHIFGNSLYSVGVRNEDATYAGLLSQATTGTYNYSGTMLTTGGFTTPATSGTGAITPADLEGGDVDTFPDQFNPSGPLDIVSLWRGASANRIRVAIVDSKAYDSIVRKRGLSSWGIQPYVLSLDSIIAQGDTKAFLLLVQFCPQNSDPTDDNQWEIVEVWNVSTDTISLDDQGLIRFAESKINGSSKYIRIALKEAQKGADFNFSTPNWVTLAGGVDGTYNAQNMDADIIAGYDLFSNAEEFDMNIFIEANKSMAVKQHITQICETRHDCMGILDCQYNQVVNNKGSETTDLINYRLGLGDYVSDNININSDKVAAYANWLEVYDQWNRKYRWIPASGYMAGIWANNDLLADPWFAPAGLNRGILQGSIRRLAWNPNQGQRDQIYKNGWNPIVSFAGQGKVAYGQKTLLDKNSAFNRINVRRLFLILEKACASSARWFLFEPNDTFTRNQFKNMLEPYLRDVQGRRGIYDFKVVCDETNNTNERIDRNELWADIMVQPEKAAEFIVLRFTATKTGASFSELAQQLAG